jgi:hypothetical protein
MSFIRPEARAVLWRWREALVGLGVALLGAWIALGGRAFVALFGVMVMLLGIGLAAAGWQRGRFRREGLGPGVVQLTEGQVAYFGPQAGGILPVERIAAVVLNPLPRSGPVWELRSPGEEPLRVPADAAGAEALFDVFAALPGFPTEAMLDALEDPGTVPRIIWARPHAQVTRLH